MENQTLLYEETKKLPFIFTDYEISDMLEIIDNSKDYFDNELGEWMKARDKTILMSSYLLALRPKEACHLHCNDVDVNDATILIRGSNNKTKKDRFLPIPNKLIPHFESYLSYSRIKFWKGSNYLFPSLENEKISPERWKSIFREKILKPLNLWVAPINSTIPKFRSYTLRHTRATQLLNKYKYIFLVANILGHGRLDSTKIYLHKSKEYVKYMRACLN